VNFLYKYCVLNSQKQSNCDLFSPMSQFSKNIKYLRESAGLSQAKFAKGFGVNRDNIASYERGSEPKVEFLTKVVNFYHITIEELLNADLEVICEENLKKSKKSEKPKENGGYLAGKVAAKVAANSCQEPINTFKSDSDPILSTHIYKIQLDEIKSLSAENAILKKENAELKAENANLIAELDDCKDNLGKTGTEG